MYQQFDDSIVGLLTCLQFSMYSRMLLKTIISLYHFIIKTCAWSQYFSVLSLSTGKFDTTHNKILAGSVRTNKKQLQTCMTPPKNPY